MKGLILLLCGVVIIWAIRGVKKDAKAKDELTRLRIENAYLEGVKVGREGGDHEKRWEELERELCKP